MRRKNKILVVSLGIAIVSFSLAFSGVFLANQWFEHHRLLFHSPIEVALFQPVRVEERKPEIIIEKFLLDYPDEIDTPIEKYICEKWGPFDCKTALAIAKAESGIREDAININANNTIDYGIFQINSVHFKKPGCSMKDLVIEEKNVDCAYSIWKAQGWTPWVAFNNGNFKTHL
jgi:hypothetical protein